MGEGITPVLYPLGTGLKERPGKGSRLLPNIERPDAALKKPCCGNCRGKKRRCSRHKRQA